jgi:hypothetical protein
MDGGFKMTQPLGNEENMAKVKALMEQAQQVNVGSELQNGVDIDFTSADGNVYRGKVVFKRPSVMDYMKMGALKSEIFRLAGVKDLNLVDPTVKFMAHVIATLKTVVVKRPEWMLDIDNMQEPEVLYHVYGKYEVWEDSFRKPDAGESEGDSSTA